MVSRLSGDNKIVGTKQVKRAINNSEAEIVYVAKDADKKIIDEIITICNEKEIEVIYVDTMEELGERCKIDVNAATAALLK
ncbi:MAG: 50S ribosomal protein L7ae-like protein [Tissierellia bacterium]|nr:50S ribosomal protein L7ae-like protein [Tissierellia bacterium]